MSSAKIKEYKVVREIDAVRADKVFATLCSLSNNIECYDVFSSAILAKRTELSQYKTLKALHCLCDLGMVERASMGCPAQFSYGEITEMICDAAPPISGWSLTEKGRETDVFQKAKKEFEDSFNAWARGELNASDDEEEGDCYED